MFIYLGKIRIIIMNKVIRLIYPIINWWSDTTIQLTMFVSRQRFLGKHSVTQDIITEAIKITSNENFLQ